MTVDEHLSVVFDCADFSHFKYKHDIKDINAFGIVSFRAEFHSSQIYPKYKKIPSTLEIDMENDAKFNEVNERELDILQEHNYYSENQQRYIVTSFDTERAHNPVLELIIS